jgi:2,5-dioxopentanoate dehydrogenase
MSDPASSIFPVLLDGAWRPAQRTGTFTATNPKTTQPLPAVYPVSGWADVDAALTAAARAAPELRRLPNLGARVADFLERYAALIESAADSLVAAAHEETALPISPRLKDVELPRTTNQLRQAAATARDGSWVRATIDTKMGIRSCLAPLGPVWILGPNNFPFAYNGVAGGDFASAIAAGNPVIAKAHPLHPTTSRLLAQLAHQAAAETQLPPGTVQMLYHLSPEDGLRLVADPRLKAIGFTGSRAGGLRLKAAADAAGKLFFGEMSSINPVIILPGSLAEKRGEIAGQFVTSVLMATGQFCTNPGLVLLQAGPDTETFVQDVAAKMSASPVGTLFSEAGQKSLHAAIQSLTNAGATLLIGGHPGGGAGFSVQNTLLRTTGSTFLANASALQTEAFGNASLVVIADSLDQLRAIVEKLDGNLTGSIYCATNGNDDAAYDALAPLLRTRVGRLLNDKMPTGVAVSPAMNHGGPYPATSNSHFSAVGFPGAMLRFTALESYDNVRPHHLPPCLQNKNPTGRMWRSIDGHWTQADI